MVGGQQDDLDSEGAEIDLAQIRKIHLKKTAALLGVSFGAGALLAGCDSRVVEAVTAAGQDLGLAFQGADDLLDVTASCEVLGKSPGKDAEAEKATWVRLEGLEKAQLRTRRLGKRGLHKLEEALPAGISRDRLLELGNLMWNRDR
jgi:geranylgeranyl diphosphate synthase type II